MKHFEDLKRFIEYSHSMKDFYKNIDVYNLRKSVKYRLNLMI